MSVRSVRLLWLAAHLLGFTPSRGLFSPLLGCHHHTATTQTYKHRHTYRRTHLHTHRCTHKRTAHTSTIAAHLKTRLHSGNTWTQCELLHAKLKNACALYRLFIVRVTPMSSFFCWDDCNVSLTYSGSLVLFRLTQYTSLSNTFSKHSRSQDVVTFCHYFIHNSTDTEFHCQHEYNIGVLWCQY